MNRQDPHPHEAYAIYCNCVKCHLTKCKVPWGTWLSVESGKLSEGGEFAEN